MKKNYNLILLIISIIVSFPFSFNNITQNNNNLRDPNLVVSTGLPVTLIVGTGGGPVDLDPIVAYDSRSIDVIEQVVEGLFAYDLGDPDLALIPRLASALGTWNLGVDEYTVPLKTGVKFHDGTDFNAAAVVAHWDRMAWALNTTGTNTVGVTQVAQLYEFPDGTPIVSNVVDNGDNTVTFFLNGPYIPFEALLSFSASYIQSPTATPANDYIDTATGDIVGTGPFVYDSYVSGVEVLFHAFDDYWGGRAQLDFIVLSEFVDANALNAALLSGDIDLLLHPMDAMLGVFNVTDGITLEEGPQGTVIQYLGMNNNHINRTLREAISYAIDYNYILDTLRGGYAVRAKSPIPQGIQYSNTTFNIPILNLTHARLVMQSMGFGVGFNIFDDTEWEAASFKSFNYTYNIGNWFRENMLVLLQGNLGKIGIKVTDAGMTWGDFLDRLYEIGDFTRDMLELYFIGWGPDYNDPSNFINPLFTNRSIASNGAQYDSFLAAIEDGRDPFALNDNVQLLMEAAIVETDPVQRERMYDRIQELLITRDMPWAWCYVGKDFRAYVDTLTGYDINLMGREWWYPITFTFTADSLSITTPNSSSTWETSTSQYIFWTSIGSISNVKIELYKSDVFEMEITSETANDGQYYWTLPSSLDNSNQYQIKIIDVSNSSIYDFSDYFEIYTPPFAIKFVQGDFVRATTTLNVRNGTNDKIGNVTAGFAGEILGPSKIAIISGIEYKFWKIDWKWKIIKYSKYSWDAFAELTPDEKIEGWVAENWLLENDIYWLAKVITNEAGGSNILEKEKVGVGWTVLNRLNCNGKHGNSIHEVAFEGYVPYWLEPHREPLDSNITKMAEDLLDGKIEDPTFRATHFFSPISQKPPYGPYPVPQSSGKIANYSWWAEPKGGWDILNEDMIYYINYKETLEWRNIEGIRNYYFMFYRYYNKEASIVLESPGELRVYDSIGRVTGLVDGVIKEEIPGSKYQIKTVIIYYSDDDYQFQIFGTAQGSYSLSISKLTIMNTTDEFNAINIPISINEIHQYGVDWITLTDGGDGVRIQIDIDGDGEFDYDFYSDSEISQDEYLDAIQDEQGTPSIPGYNLFILIGALCLVILITKKQFKNYP